MSTPDIIANIANLVVMLTLLCALLGFVIKNKAIQLGSLFFITAVVLLISWPKYMQVPGIFRGVVGDLSISGLLFLSIYAIAYFSNSAVELFERKFCLIIALLGLVLYLSTLDILPFDLYGFGYLPAKLLVLVFLLCMLFLRLNYVFAVIWLIAALAFLLHLQNSVNLWDYLLDPFLWIICVYQAIFKRNVKTYSTQIDR